MVLDIALKKHLILALALGYLYVWISKLQPTATVNLSEKICGKLLVQGPGLVSVTLSY